MQLDFLCLFSDQDRFDQNSPALLERNGPARHRADTTFDYVQSTLHLLRIRAECREKSASNCSCSGEVATRTDRSIYHLKLQPKYLLLLIGPAVFHVRILVIPKMTVMTVEKAIPCELHFIREQNRATKM